MVAVVTAISGPAFYQASLITLATMECITEILALLKMDLYGLITLMESVMATGMS